MKLVQAIPTIRTITTTDGTVAAAAALVDHVIIESSVINNEVNGVIHRIITGTGSYNNYQVFSNFGATLTNIKPSIANLSLSGRVTRLTNGVAIIEACTGTKKSRLRLDVTDKGASPVVTFGGWAVGSAFETISNDLLPMWVESKDTNLFSNLNHSTSTYTINSNCWISHAVISGVSVSMAFDGYNWSYWNTPTLITPRHAVCCRHIWYGTKNVSSVRFRANDGTIYERTVIGASSRYNGSMHDDLVVLTLSSALPSTVVPFTVAGEWLRTEQGTAQNGAFYYNAGGYAFAINQTFSAIGVILGQGIDNFETPKISGTAPYIGAWSGESAVVIASGDIEAHEDFFTTGAIPGDSGHPTIIKIGSIYVLVSVFYTASISSFVGAGNGIYCNTLIASADADAGVSTGLTVTIAADPTI